MNILQSLAFWSPLMPPDPIWNDEEQHTWLLLLRTLKAVQQHLAHAMQQENNLAMPWYDVLVTLYQLGNAQGLSMQQLAAHIMMSSSGLTRLVDRMIQAGLLERKRAADRRVVHVFLTLQGRMTIESVIPHHQARVKACVLQHLSHDEMHALRQRCQQMLEQLETNVESNVEIKDTSSH
jgi:DNA-binding MarR family transcriptional regulator